MGHRTRRSVGGAVRVRPAVLDPPPRGLLHQLLNGHAVAPGDLRQGRHVGGPLAALQIPQGREGYVGKLRRPLLRKPPLLPKNPQLHRDRSRHHSSALLRHPRSSGPRVGPRQMHYVVVHSPPWLPSSGCPDNTPTLVAPVTPLKRRAGTAALPRPGGSAPPGIIILTEGIIIMYDGNTTPPVLYTRMPPSIGPVLCRISDMNF